MREPQRSRVLLFGHHGRIGSEVSALFGDTSAGLHPADLIRYEVWAPDSTAVPLENLDAVRAAIDRFHPDIIINAAAFTNVDAAECNEAIAIRVNADAPAVMAERAKSSGAILLHLSTDYVFDGESHAPYRESAPISPINAYGRSKALGERQISDVDGFHFICRTAWVYDRKTRNFVTAILDQACHADVLHVVAEQWGSPSWATSVARMLMTMLPRLLTADRDWLQAFRGVYHVADQGYVSRSEFAREIVRLASVRPVRVVDTAATHFPSPARRPLRTGLDVAKLETVFGIRPTAWRTALATCLASREHPCGNDALQEAGDI